MEQQFAALIDALAAQGIESEVVPTGGGVDNLLIHVGPSDLDVTVSDMSTDLMLYRGDEWAQMDGPIGAELDIWDRTSAQRMAAWVAGLTHLSMEVAMCEQNPDE